MFITNTSNTKQNEPWCYRMVECLAKFPRQICRENATTKFNIEYHPESNTVFRPSSTIHFPASLQFSCYKLLTNYYLYDRCLNASWLNYFKTFVLISLRMTRQEKRKLKVWNRTFFLTEPLPFLGTTPKQCHPSCARHFVHSFRKINLKQILKLLRNFNNILNECFHLHVWQTTYQKCSFPSLHETVSIQNPLTRNSNRTQALYTKKTTAILFLRLRFPLEITAWKCLIS